MKNLFLFVLMMFTMKSATFVSDDISGLWLNQDKDAKIRIFASGGKYYGKIEWLKTPIDPETGKPKVDKHNPKPELRSRAILGLQILRNLSWDSDDQEWSGGTVYDPKSGNNYNLTCSLKDKNTMELRGYLGLSMFGRTDIWTRATE